MNVSELTHKLRTKGINVEQLDKQALTYPFLKSASSEVYDYLLKTRPRDVENTLNNKDNDQLVRQAEAQSLWQEVIALSRQRSRGDFIATDNAEAYEELVKKFCLVSHPHIAADGEGGIKNGYMLTEYLYRNNLNPIEQSSFDAAYEALKKDLELSAEAQEQLDDQKLSASEYAKKYNIRPFDDSRYYDALTGKIRERATPAHIVAGWERAIKTFRETTPRYATTEDNKQKMLAYIREHQLTLDLTGLSTAYTALTSQNQLDLQPSAEDEARRAGSQVVVVHEGPAEPPAIRPARTQCQCPGIGDVSVNCRRQSSRSVAVMLVSERWWIQEPPILTATIN